MNAPDRFKCALAALAFSHGCAMLPPDASVASGGGGIPQGSGLVIAETSNNSRRITSYIDHWKELILWRQNYEGEDKTYRISALDQSHSTQAYIGVLPAGTYRVGLLRAQETFGDITYYADALVPHALGTFDVKVGHVTNLGTITYHPFQARHRADETYPDYAMTRFANDELVRVARTLQPKFMAQISSENPVLGWLDDPGDEVRREAADLIKKAAHPTNMHLLSGGRRLLTGKSGALYLLEGGQLQNRTLTHNYEMTSLTELPSGELLLGSEFGRLSIGELGGTFQDIPMGNGPRHVIDLALSDGGVAYVVSDVVDSYEIHQYQPANHSVSLLKVLPKQYMFWGMRMTRPAVIGTTNGIAAFINREAHRFDEASSSWSTQSASEFYGVYEQPNGSVSGMPQSWMTGIGSISYSEDEGRTWNASKAEDPFQFNWQGSSPYRPSYRFADGEIIQTAQDIRLRFSWMEGSDFETRDSAAVLSTTDDGVSWANVGSVPTSCLDIAVEASTDEAVHILCDDGRVIVSIDRGRNWQEVQREWEVPNLEDFPAPLKVRFTHGENVQEQQSIAPMIPTLVQ